MAPLSRPVAQRLGAGATRLAALVGGAALLAGGGAVFASAIAPSLQSRYFPWITGRALGVASFVCLWALVALGTAIRHPWRARLGRPHPEALLRAHAALGVATLGLVAAHVAFLASDRYAGVGWLGAVVPGLSRYRPSAVALGIVGTALFLVVAGTARLAGRRGTRHWLALHRLAGPTFALVWLHGTLAGTDTAALRPLYLATAATVVLLATSRAVARRDEHARRPAERLGETR